MQSLQVGSKGRLSQEELDILERSFDTYVNRYERPTINPTYPPDIPLSDIDSKLDRLTWLLEGADSYNVIDDTVGSTREVNFDYGPFLLWAISIVNGEASGGNNLLLRFTDSHGRVKQHRIRAASTLDVNLTGTMGSKFKLIARENTVETIGLILLKWPFKEVRRLNI